MAEKFKLDSDEMKKVGKGCLIAGVGAVLVYLAEAIPGIDFGAWTPIAVAVFGVATNFVRKWITYN